MRYVIGDIHGCSKTLTALIRRLELSGNDELYFVGDLIDRGPGSKEVVDQIIYLSLKYKVICCRGNHEQLMLDSERSEEDFDRWLRNGGGYTLRSFGCRKYSELPASYRSFFESMKLYHELPDFLIVHAGFNFSENDIFSDQYAMLWTRDHRCELSKTKNRTIIHGHSPVTREETFLQLSEGKGDINIDNGCVYFDRPGFGNLTAIRLEDLELISVPYFERPTSIV
jgi:serine/threonine protein phosphatase 1